jgi:CRP-like cAMP-binding protein
MPAKPFDSRNRNAILNAAPEAERAILDSQLESVELPFNQILQEPYEPMRHMWFPSSGVCSILSAMEDGTSVEIATVGREGFVGLPIVLDARLSGQRTIVQISGAGQRLPAATYLRLKGELPGFERVLLRYALSLVGQIAQGSACNRLHPIEARCARWLLQTHDRVDGDTFTLTHEFLAQMLGVTRPSVTIAAGMLQKAGLIRYVRGVVDVLDRPGLEAASCECYRVIVEDFRRLLEPAR